MPDISMVKQHDLDAAVLRERLQELADWLKKKYGIRSRWEGDSCLLEGSGLKRGVVTMTPTEIRVEVTLAMLAKMLKAQVQKEIDNKINRVLSG
jgi:putative polyhydroxyalkanoate system protein